MQLAASLKPLILRGSLDEAFSLWSIAPPTDPEFATAARLVVPAFISAGRAAEVSHVLETAAASNPNLVWLIQLQVQVATALGDQPGRLRHLRHAFELQPGTPGPYAALTADLVSADMADSADAVAQEHAAHVCFAMQRLTTWQAPPKTELAVDPQSVRTRRLFLDLLERAVSNWIYGDAANVMGKLIPFDPDRRRLGKDIPEHGHTMIGLERLRHLRTMVEEVLERGVPGDLVEAGVWRGGACILMAGVLEAWSDDHRRVVAADTFAGLPPPDPRYPKDALTTFNFHLREELSIGAAQVRSNFERYGLWGPRVVLLEGLFCNTLPQYPYGPIAVLRMDGDLYSSTMDTLVHLYDRVSPGGIVISDDYGVVIDARRAVLDFRAQRGITSEMLRVDKDAVFWRKPG